MRDFTQGEKIALDHARYLADNDVPIFRARPAKKDGAWDPSGGHNGCGYWLPEAWQNTKPDPGVADRWKPGEALCAVMGRVVDAVDVDPRHGGNASYAQMVDAGMKPTIYGRQATPSDGFHDVICALGVHSRDGVLDGIDVKAGHEGQGHGFIFLAPTQKVSKVTGEVATYAWIQPPDLDMLLVGPDDSGSGCGTSCSRRPLPPMTPRVRRCGLRGPHRRSARAGRRPRGRTGREVACSLRCRGGVARG